MFNYLQCLLWYQMLYWMLYINWFSFHHTLKGRWWYSHFINYRDLREGHTRSSVLAWRIPGMVEPGGLPSVGSQSRTQLKRLCRGSSSRSSSKDKLDLPVSGPPTWQAPKTQFWLLHSSIPRGVLLEQSQNHLKSRGKSWQMNYWNSCALQGLHGPVCCSTDENQ